MEFFIAIFHELTSNPWSVWPAAVIVAIAVGAAFTMGADR